jgi:hypothetical protein
MYKTLVDPFTNQETAILRLSDNAYIPFDPANVDFQNFKKEVIAGAELQTAEGQIMSQEEANQFIATLP